MSLLPILLFVAFATYQREQTLRDGERTIERTIQILEEHALRVFESQQLIIDQIDQYLGFMSWADIAASEEVHRFLQRTAAASPHVDGLWLVPPDGRTANSADFFPFPDVKVADRQYFRTLRESDVVYFGEMIVGRTKGTFNFNLSRRRSPRETFNGLILVTASLDYFTDFWEQASDGPFVAGIFREDGEILARYPTLASLPERLSAASPLVVRMRTSDGEVYRSRSTLDGEGRVYGYSRVGTTPLFIGYGTSTDHILSSWRREILPMGLIAFLASAFLGAASLTITRQNRRLSATAVSWQQTAGKLEAEVDRRVRAEDVASERKRLLDEVGALTAQRQSILENIAEGLVALDDEGRIIYANREASQLLGPLPEGEAFASLVEAQRLRAADGSELDPARAPELAPLEGENLPETELIVRNEAGQQAICLFRGGAIVGSDGRAEGAVLTFWDITERKRDAERRDLLMRELDHRVRNMLATITAMIRISNEPGQSKEDFVAALSGRVGALSRTHGVLSEGQWQGATIGRLVDDEMRRLAQSGKVALDGDPDVMLPPKSAADLALALHELSTNAIKHGAWSVPDGKVSLAWKLDRVASGPCLRVDWKETGGPPIKTAPERQGFGSTLLQGLFSDGEGVELDFEPDGLHCTMCATIHDTRHGRKLDGPAAPAAKPPTEAASLTGVRVLVVEDEAVVRLDLVEMLREAGAEVAAQAGSLADGLARADGVPVDVAVLDMNLNGESSVPIARALAGRGAAIVFASGYQASGLTKADFSHPYVYLQKPISQEALVGAVTEARARRG